MLFKFRVNIKSCDISKIYMCDFSNENDEPWNPLAVMLSMYGNSSHSKLLFRYPFMEKLQSCCHNTSSSVHLNGSSGASGLKDQIVNCAFNDIEQEDIMRGETEQLLNFNEATIAHILSPGKEEMCDKPFDVKINGLRFVGFTLKLQQENSRNNKKVVGNKEDVAERVPIDSFNVVFVLKTSANFSMVQSYKQLAAKISRSISAEEIRSQYMSEQVRLMLAIHDNESLDPAQIHDCILNKCTIAESVQQIFTDVRNSGIVEVLINDNIRISFCLYQKVLTSVTATLDEQLMINEPDMTNVLNNIQPYHGLLVYNLKEVTESLNFSCSTSIMTFLNACKPTKSLLAVSRDIYFPLNHVYACARHLVAWGKACIIYPLCESNVYMLAPTADFQLALLKASDFYNKFGITLQSMLSSFSLPVCLGELWSPRTPFFKSQKHLIEIVYWMLQHRFLLQHHIFVFFVPPNNFGQTTCKDANQVRRKFASFAAKKHTAEIAYSSLPIICKSVLQPANVYSNGKDLSLFFRLFKYLNGQHHLEDIMYRENMARSELLTILDKFRSMLVTTSRTDPITCSLIKNSYNT